MRTLLRSVAVASLLVLGGCTAGSGDAADESTAASDSGGMAVENDSATEDFSGADGAVGETGAAVSDRQVVTSGSVTMTVEDPQAAADEVARLVQHTGGHVQERVEQSARDEADARASLVIRVPSAEVTTVLGQLEVLGTVENISITSTEVTAQARDLDARIRALEISIQRLEEMLSGAGTTSELVDAEQVLTDRQVQLETLQSQRAALADQVEMSTIRLELWTEDAVPEEAPTGFWGGLVAGWSSLLAALGGALQVIGVLIPWLVFLGLAALAVVAVVRVLSRRRAATAPPAAPTGTDAPGPAAGHDPQTASPVGASARGPQE